MPGEPEQRARLARRDGIPIDDTTHAQLIASALAAGVPADEVGFV
jgi:LDH2 family malate/lactate/ureidoglycolate dehydrogenase